jgi:hypothetical protein
MTPLTNTPTIIPDREIDEEKNHDSFGPRHPLPALRLVARKEDKWFCTCGYDWNTFDTGGVCPACLHQWAETQCLACSRWSPHSNWYAE